MQPAEAEDFPRTLPEFDRRFATEEACAAYLEALRWPGGFHCPCCGHDHGWPIASRGLIQCAKCDRQTSLTAGTVLHGTRKPLTVWFRAMWMVATRKTGVSACDLERALGLTAKVAWAWLQKLRRGMVRPNRERLSGLVEVDEAFIACLAPRVDPGRNVPVVIGIELRDGGGLGRIRLTHVEDKSAVSLMPAVTAMVEPGSTVHTDGCTSYIGLEEAGYSHTVSIIGGSKDRAIEELPHVHLVASLLRRFLLGTYQGAAKSWHLQHYFEKVVREGFEERLGEIRATAEAGRGRHAIEDYRERLDREIKIVREMGFAGYFLITWDFIRYAREASIPVGTGARVGGGVAGGLLPAHHEHRPHAVRPAVRALPQSGACLDARHRHRLLLSQAGAGHRLRDPEVRSPQCGADHHLRHDGGAGGDPRRRSCARGAVQRRGPHRQAGPRHPRPGDHHPAMRWPRYRR